MEPPVLIAERRAPGMQALQIVLLALAAAGTIAAARYSLAHNLAWQCQLLQVTGFPCPFCGTTRAFAALADFQWLAALALNPLAVLALPLALLFPRVVRYSRGPWLAGILIAALALNWLYLLCFLPR